MPLWSTLGQERTRRAPALHSLAMDNYALKKGKRFHLLDFPCSLTKRPCGGKQHK